ncbi:hypothetical protein L6164_021269 [Bauhinia variegata]|uniref:Uncharacterized protein n=1 Tax=Bauhinia variegata TaxID=167791 RepID=A0ACB9MZQ1_BAUVA|nr:hypothetical protein L6164_021269 [Bauhinia variegata]
MFGGGEKSSEEFCASYHHLHDQGKEVITKKLPKGFLAIKVGQGEEQQRIVVPVLYLNHPLFAQLLKEAEEEYGFEYHEGAITIPCHVEEFRYIQGTIEREKSLHHHHHLGCFRASTRETKPVKLSKCAQA